MQHKIFRLQTIKHLLLNACASVLQISKPYSIISKFYQSLQNMAFCQSFLSTIVENSFQSFLSDTEQGNRQNVMKLNRVVYVAIRIVEKTLNFDWTREQPIKTECANKQF